MISYFVEYTFANLIMKLKNDHTKFKTFPGADSREILHYVYPTLHSRHGCISDASLRRLIPHLRDISKKADMQISETSPGKLIRDVSLETSLRSLRFSHRRLWVASETVILGFETKGSFWLPAHQSIILLIILPN